jgi:hypothetical protein
MAHQDDLRPADLLRVNVTRYNDIRYWAREFKCTPDQLRAAVKAAGTSSDAVKAYLAKQ